MGCDIHMYTEAKMSVNGNPTWVCVDSWKLNRYYGEAGEPQYEVRPVYRARDYSLFTLLAGVRSSGDNPVLSDRRGLPRDASDAINDASDRWGGDGHSHGWATLKELVDFNAEHKFVSYTGMVSPEQAKLLDEEGVAPDSWCGATSDRTYVQRSFKHEQRCLERLIEVLTERAKDEFWVFVDAALTDEQMENFRIVFWFDN